MKNIKVKERPGMGYILDGVNYTIYSNIVDIVCNINNIKVEIRNIKTDIIKIITQSEIFVDSCQANLIEPYMINNWRKFSLKNSQVKELNIDLDLMRNWQVENCEIEVENLTGSGTHRVTQPKSEAKIMNWIPKNQDAQLVVTLLGDTAKVIF